MEEILYNLKIGEEYMPHNLIKYLRVPNGWIVTEFTEINAVSCFVPYNIC